MTQIPTIKQVRAFTLKGGGADYHDQSDGHWIDDHIATPMAKYPEYRQSRRSFGINVLGTLVVEIEDSAGRVGFAVTTGGEQLHELFARRRVVQVFDDGRLDAGGADQCEDVARRAAFGIVVDGDG